jgi:small subunit ribosomal protein S17
MTPAAGEKRLNTKRQITGVVKSDKMNKTIVVGIDTKIKHAEYGKIINRHMKFKAHDEENKAKIGDRVTIQECRPLSKDKRWTLIEIHAK